MTPLGKRLRELREKKGLSVRDFAKEIRKSPGYVSRIEIRNEVPSPELLLKIADFHKIDPVELFDLSKKTQLKITVEEIDAKHSSAIALYRKERK